MKAHRFADIVPMIPRRNVSEMLHDIRHHGLREPIMVFEGDILDGRTRYIACRRAGIEPKTENYSGSDALLYALEANRGRLNQSQTAMVIARAVLVFARDPHELSTRLNVSIGMTRRAIRLLMNGTEEQIAAVLAGKQAVSTIADKLSKNNPPNAPAPAPRRKPGPRPRFVPPPPTRERRRTTLTDAAELWSHLREAIGHITSLPCATDAVTIISKLPPQVRGVVDQKLPSVMKWMEEFSHEWKSRNEHRSLAKSQNGAAAGPAGGRGNAAEDAAGAGGDDGPGHGARAP